MKKTKWQNEEVNRTINFQKEGYKTWKITLSIHRNEYVKTRNYAKRMVTLAKMKTWEEFEQELVQFYRENIR